MCQGIKKRRSAHPRALRSPHQRGRDLQRQVDRRASLFRARRRWHGRGAVRARSEGHAPLGFATRLRATTRHLSHTLGLSADLFLTTFRGMTLARIRGGGIGEVSMRRVFTHPSDRYRTSAFAVGMLRDDFEKHARSCSPAQLAS